MPNILIEFIFEKIFYIDAQYFKIYLKMVEKEDDPNILFVCRKMSVCWGMVDEGFFIMSNGNVYNFNLVPEMNESDDDYSSSSEEDYDFPNKEDFIKSLIDISKRTKPSKECNRDEILKAYKLVGQIDKNSQLVLTASAFDSGQKTLSAFYNGYFIPLTTNGDESGGLDCKELKQILDILENANFYKWDSINIDNFIQNSDSRRINVFPGDFLMNF